MERGVCVEMVSAKGIFYNNKNLESLLQIHPEEVPVSLQFLVQIRRSSARWQETKLAQERPFFHSGYQHTGCPVPRSRNGEGLLMKIEAGIRTGQCDGKSNQKAGYR